MLANISQDGDLRQISFGTAMIDTQLLYTNLAPTPMPCGQSLATPALATSLRIYI